MRRALFVAVVAAWLLAFPVSSPAREAARIQFSFQGYANNVRVRPPLVGPWQLGVARVNGSGTISGSIDGSVRGNGVPLFSRYAPSSFRASMVGYSYFRAAHGAYTKLTVTIEIERSSDTRNCPSGTRGTLRLYDSAEKLENGQRSDSITMSWPRNRCPGLVQGWTNHDGGERTSPSFGGPPRGGQWAVVRINAS